MASLYKTLIGLNVARYRLSRGLIGDRVALLLTTMGRKTGKARTISVIILHPTTQEQ